MNSYTKLWHFSRWWLGGRQLVRRGTLPAAPCFRSTPLSVGTWEPSVRMGSVQGWAISGQTLFIL